MPKDSTLRWLCLFWISVGAVLWPTIGNKNVSYFSSVIAIAALLATIVFQWRSHRNLSADWWTYFAFFFAVPGAFYFTEVINPDSLSGHAAPSTCLVTMWGTLHLHHWGKALVLVLWQAVLFGILMLAGANTQNLLYRYGRWTLRLGLVHLVVASAIAALQTWNTSLWADLAGYGLYLLLLGQACMSGHPSSPWLWRYVALSWGMAIGVHINGIASIPGELRQGNNEALVFWHPLGEKDPRCIVPPEK